MIVINSSDNTIIPMQDSVNSIYPTIIINLGLGFIGS